MKFKFTWFQKNTNLSDHHIFDKITHVSQCFDLPTNFTSFTFTDKNSWDTRSRKNTSELDFFFPQRSFINTMSNLFFFHPSKKCPTKGWSSRFRVKRRADSTITFHRFCRRLDDRLIHFDAGWESSWQWILARWLDYVSTSMRDCVVDRTNCRFHDSSFVHSYSVKHSLRRMELHISSFFESSLRSIRILVDWSLHSGTIDDFSGSILSCNPGEEVHHGQKWWFVLLQLVHCHDDIVLVRISMRSETIC